ncbi:MAG: hypothetical protein K0S86_283 [Geminicoccaceae bacterium]|nr:hypothetical protein [Geminicoccaceae bacterium]
MITRLLSRLRGTRGARVGSVDWLTVTATALLLLGVSAMCFG